MPPESTNKLLLSLSHQASDYLIARSVPIALPLRTMLYEAEQTPAYAYFMTSGMASVVTSMEDGSTAEVGVVGREGVVGSIFLLGPARVSTNAFMQLDGTALRIPMSEIRKVFRASEETRDRILESVQQESLAVSQISACNRLHMSEERLARWLLMAQDRSQTDVMEFTQEFLALMLGSRRTTVTLVAGTLQRRGLIEYSRGRVRILDRPGLEAIACDCYQVTKRLLAGLYRSKLSRSGNAA